MVSNKHLLVINDEPDMLDQIKKWLSQEGYIIQSALRGNDGVKIANNGHFDLIIVDYNLKKETDGEKTAKYFIPDLIEANPATPIIVISATERNISAEELGVTDVLIVDSTFWKRLLIKIEDTLRN